MTKNYRILIISSFANSLVNFRGDFILALVDKGFQVYCAAPDMSTENREELFKRKAYPISYTLERKGLNPLKDIASIRELKRLMKKHRIDVVFPYTIKPVIYGSIAARQLNLTVVSLITGLGYTFSGIGNKAKILQTLTENLYRNALRKNAVVIFQNKDDQELFIDREIISTRQKSAVVNGSGINLDRFPFRERSHIEGDPVRFVLIGRLSEEKGTGLFIRAARKLKEAYNNSEFHLIGEPPEEGKITRAQLEEIEMEGIIRFHGYQKNVIPILEQCDVFVLPSFYREGVPRSILEALSLGMPVITTHMPGCRETVNGRNGFLVKPRSFEPLLNAMRQFLDQPGTIGIMGRESRKLAEGKFDVNLVNNQLIKLICSHLP